MGEAIIAQLTFSNWLGCSRLPFMVTHLCCSHSHMGECMLSSTVSMKSWLSLCSAMMDSESCTSTVMRLSWYLVGGNHVHPVSDLFCKSSYSLVWHIDLPNRRIWWVVNMRMCPRYHTLNMIYQKIMPGVHKKPWSTQNQSLVQHFKIHTLVPLIAMQTLSVLMMLYW